MSKCVIFEKGDKLLNDNNLPTKESLEAIVLLHPHLALLGIGNTIIRRDYCDIKQIKVLSGGASGHEPLYSGFVGKGFLTASIQGDVFCAPASYDIKNVIKELCHGSLFGILIIIGNHSGDTLNFGVAVEKAISEGCKVKLLIVSDDASDVLCSKKTDQPTGLTGVVLIQKIASALAEDQQKSLTEIYSYCNDIQTNMTTVFITLSPCTSRSTNTCICMQHYGTAAVIGGGLEGESVKKSVRSYNTESVVNEVLKDISKNLTIDEKPMVVLLSTMCLSKLEETILVGQLIKKLKELQINVKRFYIGTFISCLDMKGFTVTAMKVDDKILELLDCPTEALSWNTNIFEANDLALYLKPRTRIPQNVNLQPKGPQLSEREANILLLVLQFSCDALISCERQLNIIDSELGDGDTGSRIRIAAEEILTALKSENLELKCLYLFFRGLSKIVEKIGGTLAAIYVIIFEAAGNLMANTDETVESHVYLWITCLFNVIHSVKSHSKCQESSNNLVTPLVACVETMDSVLSQANVSGIDAFGYGVAAAEEASKKTRLPGRKYPDPGAHSVTIWLRAAFEAVKFRCDT